MKKGRDEDFWQKKTIATYILSVLVLLIHCSTFANYPNLPAAINVLSVFWQQVITPVAVPLFFIISGALFYRNYESDMKSYISKMKTRIRSLFVPYICWNVLNMMFQILCTELLSEYFVGREKFVFSAWNILGGVFHYKYNGPFWFIFALLVFTIFTPVIDLIIKNKYMGTGIIIGLLVLCNFGIGLPQPMFFDRTCILYYLIGGIVGKHYFEKWKEVSSFRVQTLSVCGCMISWIYEFMISFGWIQKYVILDVVILVMFSFSLWRVFDIICRIIACHDFMKHSFWVFALHINVSAVITKVLYIVCPENWFWALANFVVTIFLTLFLIEVVCRAVKKFCPGLYGILSGLR